MVVTISEKAGGYVILRCKHPGFRFQFCNGNASEVTVTKTALFSKMVAIADFANNREGEECIFEVE